MIKYARIVNSRGLTVLEKILGKEPFFTSNNENLIDSIISSLFADLQISYPKKLKLTNLESKDLPDGYFCYFFIINFDLFIIFTNKNVTQAHLEQESLLDTIIKERKLERSSFKGIVIADFDDVMGPMPIFSSSQLNESELAILAVQGTTVLGMSMENMPNYTVGPVPIPSNPNLLCLIRGFQRSAPNSEDPRIKLGGRPATIFIIISASISLDKESNTFIDAFLQQWIISDAVKEIFDEKDMIQMSVDLEQVLVLAQDLVKVRDVQIDKLRNLLKWYTTENLILRQEISHLRMEIESSSKTKLEKIEKKELKGAKSKKKPKKRAKKKKK